MKTLDIHFKNLCLTTSFSLGLTLTFFANSSIAASLCGGYTSDLFGDHVCLFDSGFSKGDIQSLVDGIHSQYMGKDAEMNSNGYALMFKPGNYGNLKVSVGYYTHVLGLGRSPDDTILDAVKVDEQDLHDGTSLDNFWRSAENIKISGNNVWAVSQASPLRRVHVGGVLVLSLGGEHYASGGFLANSKIDQGITSKGQQQWLTRNTSIGQWYDPGVWNMVFVGDNGAPNEGDWGLTTDHKVPNTVVEKTPLSLEAPYLVYDSQASEFQVVVPQVKENTLGEQWQDPNSQTIAQSNFIIVKPSDVEIADQIQNQLKEIHNNSPVAIIVTPGQYDVSKTITIHKDNTIVMGIGLPVLTAIVPHQSILVAQANGLRLGGIIFEAGSNQPIQANDPSLVEINNSSSPIDHSHSLLYDTYCRVGGRVIGQTNSCITVNQNGLIGDNLWLWRGDHGKPGTTGEWNLSQANHGLIVNGQNVMMYGLAVEHFMANQTIWNGNNGKIYFYQSELPYDVPANFVVPASLKVSQSVTSLQALGLGIYDFFRGTSMNASSDSAIEAPFAQAVRFKHMLTVKLGESLGTMHIQHILKIFNGAAIEYYGDNNRSGMAHLSEWNWKNRQGVLLKIKNIYYCALEKKLHEHKCQSYLFPKDFIFDLRGS